MHKVPLFFPVPRISKAIDSSQAVALEDLLQIAGVPCRASGAWTKRPVVMEPTDATAVFIEREAGDVSCVRIGVPRQLSAQDQARYAAAVMAYAVMDLVARQSLKGVAWAHPAKPAGRPPTGRARTAAQRQRAFRARNLQERQAQTPAGPP